MQELEEYERRVVEPRDQRNNTLLTTLTADMANVKNLIQQGSGAVKLGGFSLTLASFIWIVLQIIHHVRQ